MPGQSEQRYQRMFDRYSREVFAYCRRRTDAHTAADCAAETFLVAWRRLDEVPDGAAELGWLYSVARKVMANEYRRMRRSRRLLTRLRGYERPPDPLPDALVVKRERDELMLTALAALRPQDQEVLRLAWWEDLSHAEVAALVGCSTEAASQRIHRAARRVAKEFQRLDHRGHVVTGTHRQPQGGEQG